MNIFEKRHNRIVFAAGLAVALLASVIFLLPQKSYMNNTSFENAYYQYLVAATDPTKIKWAMKLSTDKPPYSLSFNQRWYIRCIDDAQFYPGFDGYRLMNFPTNMVSGLVGLPAWSIDPGTQVFTAANVWGYFLKSDVENVDLSTAKEKFYSRINYLLNTIPSQRLIFNHTKPLQIIDLPVNNVGGAIIGVYSLRATHVIELMASKDGGKTYNFACPIHQETIHLLQMLR
jgi:hypothetical protein